MRNASQEDVFWIVYPCTAHAPSANFQINNGQFATLRLSEPNLVPPGASVTAVMRNASQEDVFWIGNDGAVHATFANFQINNGRFATLRLSEPNLAPPGASVTARR